MPDQVRAVFGKRRTLPIGAAFGVITVRGTKEAGQIEVATFRTEAGYTDGRRPDAVAFTNAEQDAGRRDFTINGLFYDPVDERVIDYVGGQQDLRARVIRAIGAADERFGEDKLRMLRAVRFAASLGFSIDPQTADAIRRHAAQIAAVSPERIGVELRRMLLSDGRGRVVDLLAETALLDNVLGSFRGAGEEAIRDSGEILSALQNPTAPAALACLLTLVTNAGGVSAAAHALRWTKKEGERAAWLRGNFAALRSADRQPWSTIQPLLAHQGGPELVAVYEAVSGADGASRFCGAKLALPRDELDPPPLLTGDDLVRLGFHPGPAFAGLLRGVRCGQLDGEIASADAAAAWVRSRGQAGR